MLTRITSRYSLQILIISFPKNIQCTNTCIPKSNYNYNITATSDTLQIICPGLSTLAKICMTIPVGTASEERFFSQMKLIKTRLRNRLGEENLSNLMKIAIKSPESLQDEQLEY